MFQFAQFAPFPLSIRVRVSFAGWVPPFGYPRIKAYSQLPAAFRSVSRPSSPLIAKASTKCSYHSLDSYSCINNLLSIHLLSKIYPYSSNKGILYFLLRFIFLLFTLSYNFTLVKILFLVLVEVRRFELLTPCLQSRCSPS